MGKSIFHFQKWLEGVSLLMLMLITRYDALCVRVAGSRRMSSCLDELAALYPGTKFVRIVSTDCIPDVRR